MSVRLLSICFAALIVLLVLELVRRENLTFKYAIGWLLISFAGMTCAVWDVIPRAVATGLGFTLTSNFVFFAVLGGFILLGLLFTVFLCQQNQRNDRMAQKIGILEMEVRRLNEQREPSP